MENAGKITPGDGAAARVLGDFDGAAPTSPARMRFSRGLSTGFLKCHASMLTFAQHINHKDGRRVEMEGNYSIPEA